MDIFWKYRILQAAGLNSTLVTGSIKKSLGCPEYKNLFVNCRKQIDQLVHSKGRDWY